MGKMLEPTGGPALMRLFSRLYSAVCLFCGKLRQRTSAVFPLGIAARLSVAFIAVVILAATANILVSKTALMIRTSALASDLPSNALLPANLAVRANTALPANSVGAGNSAAVAPKFEDASLAAIDRFESITRRRADSGSKNVIAQYMAATAKLRAAFASLERGAAAAGANRSTRIARKLDDYIHQSAALVAAGDNVRGARLQYAMRLESMDERISASLDHAWHIFGRVIARQSLMKLHIDVELLRQRSQQANPDDPFGSPEDASLAAAEQSVSENLANQERASVGSQGTQWQSDMHTDLAALPAIRASMAREANALAAASGDFDRSRADLSAEMKLSTTVVSTHQNVNVTAAAGMDGELAAQRTMYSSVGVLPHEAAARAILTQSDPRARTLMAAVTTVVMFLIAGICVLTVRSVLLPIRRILRATRGLAAGAPLPRVSPGGIRELSNLAVAFNDMADKLEAAQQTSLRQQESLEVQVLERTHKLQRLAERDPLTSLPNRRHLFGKLNSAIERAAQGGGYIGVYFLDIDNFKNYNDSLGHVFGDRVLMSAANRLEEISEGKGFVARFGGDEFTIVYEDAGGLESVREFGAALVAAFHQFLPVDARELSVSVSVGASVFPLHSEDADGLLRTADSALFRAKELGRNQVALFTPTLIETAAARFTIEQGLRRALERGEFELVYQPEVDLATFQMGLVEALLRWRMPDGRLASPGEFLAVAEQSGLIVDINDWVLRKAVQCAAEWHRGHWPGARVAVNVTPRQLLDERFTDRILALLREFNAPPSCIELELTESVLQTGASTIAALRNLQAHGIRIALDDFGTGYSSLTSLEQLPLSRIKLDRSLIVNIDTSPRAAAIAQAILDLCAGLELEVTVEGIERPDQFAWLLRQRSVYLQGYLLSAPVSGDEIVALKSSIVQRMQDLLLTTNSESNKESVAAPEKHGAVCR